MNATHEEILCVIVRLMVSKAGLEAEVARLGAIRAEMSDELELLRKRCDQLIDDYEIPAAIAARKAAEAPVIDASSP